MMFVCPLVPDIFEAMLSEEDMLGYSNDARKLLRRRNHNFLISKLSVNY